MVFCPVYVGAFEEEGVLNGGKDGRMDEKLIKAEMKGIFNE